MIWLSMRLHLVKDMIGSERVRVIANMMTQPNERSSSRVSEGSI